MRYASRLLGDPDRGGDVVQDTFLRLCREKPARIRGHVAEWLFTVCRNRAFDILKKEKRMQPLPEGGLETQAGSLPSPERLLAAKEGVSEVLKVLDTLSANKQEVVRLKFQNGLSYREISRITGLTESNVGFLLHTALKEIRTKVHSDTAPGRERIRRIK